MFRKLDYVQVRMVIYGPQTEHWLTKLLKDCAINGDPKTKEEPLKKFRRRWRVFLQNVIFWKIDEEKSKELREFEI